ncbi:ABC-type cobalamin/Fe3+-siderophore transport system, ATPase component [Actinoalloteichus sp. GBA129-24]|uniref:ABC-type cobalamin/Fe3+-siderophore transport system, ATPase component n=1 Tax=Actinoalloteichus fjordicus TaxID=1612552 RepID=A0AAC9LCH7_9PSEU|nr:MULTISPECIES: ABC transporter ATP-binding protein [Actinoalloteichus]APU14177.1 ABC-type cobalamin/Fe3+-siderophore transport system, ATPase component [Actinoalloteichus fjordicus]APU20123.1 ABC-type cobalamin/Fe3+-siderophore transport system, ATPase component [Actinoalloteichus sp. GBA129-24]
MSARDLDVAYGRDVVVHAASISLDAGTVTALIGPNGSGKSTLLRALARLHPPVAGDVTFADGAELRALSGKDLARRITLLSQHRTAPGGLCVRELVDFGRHPHRSRWGGRDDAGPAAVERAMALTGLTSIADRPVQALSGGQAQRVWLASCLAQDTALLLLDEPTTFLDLRYQVEILDVVRDLADEHGVGVGVVLHDLDQAGAIADRLVLLEEGRITADGTPGDVLTTTNLTRAYGIRVDVDVDPIDGRIHTRAVGRFNCAHARAASV